MTNLHFDIQRPKCKSANGPSTVLFMLPVITRVPRGSPAARGGMGIAVKHARVQVLVKPSADSAITSNFLSLWEIQSTQMELLSPVLRMMRVKQVNKHKALSLVNKGWLLLSSGSLQHFIITVLNIYHAPPLSAQ